MRHEIPGIKRVVIAGGKTGGHLFPGIAVAQALKTEAPDTRILFVGTNAPFEVSTLARYGFDHKTIVSRPIKGGSLLSKAWSGAIVLVSVIQALWILIRFRANFVLGVGGFSSFALVLAARMLGRRTAIQEQNACPGMTNRMLAKVSHTIFIAFEQTRGLPVNAKTFWVGNPIRMDGPAAGNTKNPETSALADEPETAFLEALAPETFLILVTGGSQGAASINKAFMDAAAQLDKDCNIAVVHQTGKAQEADIRAQYKKMSLNVHGRGLFPPDACHPEPGEPGHLPGRSRHPDRTCGTGKGGRPRPLPLCGRRPPDRQCKEL